MQTSKWFTWISRNSRTPDAPSISIFRRDKERTAQRLLPWEQCQEACLKIATYATMYVQFVNYILKVINSRSKQHNTGKPPFSYKTRLSQKPKKVGYRLTCSRSLALSSVSGGLLKTAFRHHYEDKESEDDTHSKIRPVHFTMKHLRYSSRKGGCSRAQREGYSMTWNC